MKTYYNKVAYSYKQGYYWRVHLVCGHWIYLTRRKSLNKTEECYKCKWNNKVDNWGRFKKKKKGW